jgi:glyoxylase-like metal-dependent hydrolase (beta-lactamase superfamily II)
MKIQTISAGLFKLDGGAMFGVVPKKLWNKMVPSDENNLCTWSMRCLLVETGNRKILVDCGMGNKQSDKFMGHYEPHGETLENALQVAGVKADEITDVFLTHLHFDHCGGAVARDHNDRLIPAFPNATYWTNEAHWQWATNPNGREKASFLPENMLPLQEHGVLSFLKEDEELAPGFSTIWVYGHTEAMMLPVLDTGEKTMVYMADLLPSAAHIPLPYIMGYDVRPLETLKEKERFLSNAVRNGYYLLFEHDAVHEACYLRETEKGIRPDKFYSLSTLMSA